MTPEQHYPHERGASEFDFDRFFRDHRKPLERYIGARIGMTADCEDLASEVMCQLLTYCRQHPEREIHHHRALLFKIARNRLVDYYKQWKREVLVKPLEDAPQIPALGSTPEAIDADDELQGVRAALVTIREEYREVITLHAIVGLSIREIAELMDKPDVNVRVLLYRARRSLRKVLRKQQPGHYGPEEVEQP